MMKTLQTRTWSPPPCCALLAVSSVHAQQPPGYMTPDKVESSIGTLEYKDGFPSDGTVAKAYDYLDLMHGVEAFVNAYQGASVASIFKGIEDAGIPTTRLSSSQN